MIKDLLLKFFKREIAQFPDDFQRLNLYALFYVRRVRDSLYPWDLGYGRNEEWINLLTVFDSVEVELDNWNKKQKKKEELEEGNYIPPRKGSIKDKVDALSERDRKPKKEKGTDKSVQIEVPWKHTKQTIKSLKKLFGV